MNEDLAREHARERLAAAELATVLEVPVARVVGRSQRPGHLRLLVAASVLLGIGVVGASAWLQFSDDRAQAQDRGPVDVVRPWWQQDLPFFNVARVRTDSDVAALSSDVRTVAVTATKEIRGWWNELLAKRHVRSLFVSMAEPDALQRADWSSLAEAPQLESLWLESKVELSPDHIYELRHAKNLRAVGIVGNPRHQSAPVLTRAVTKSLVALPQLRFLGIVGEPEGGALELLSGLPNLDTLLLEGCTFSEATIAAVSRIAQLRTLEMTLGRGSRRTSATQLRNLARMRHLRSLGMGGFDLYDEDLARLPRQLESLSFSSLHNVTSKGLRALAKLEHLRALSFRSSLPYKLEDSLAGMLEAFGLESFALTTSHPSSKLWPALIRSPVLRGFTMSCSTGFGKQLQNCAKLRHLEHLVLKVDWVPDAQEFEPLRQLPNLKTVVVEMRRELSGAAPKASPHQASPNCLGPEVKVDFRWRGGGF